MTRSEYLEALAAQPTVKAGPDEVLAWCDSWCGVVRGWIRDQFPLTPLTFARFVIVPLPRARFAGDALLAVHISQRDSLLVVGAGGRVDCQRVPVD